MEQIAFKMQLNPGQATEYKRRHDDIWPELVTVLKDAGICDYSIFIDEETYVLFAVLRRKADHGMDTLPDTAIMQKWWAYMGDIMATNADDSPVSRPLLPVFHMP
ncbi:L-rhamnose mutarotase [Thalassospira sp. NFXS8]|jgi:L-rhamnose mutarotase|uniref:L-rhamnose mutarotase n=1 Tax=unclassified Thalassospira TaxID=2648997 RepID=UPI0032DE63AF